MFSHSKFIRLRVFLITCVCFIFSSSIFGMPTFNFIKPTAGSHVHGQINIELSTIDDPSFSIIKAELYVDGTLYHSKLGGALYHSKLGASNSFLWNTTGLSNSGHTLLAKFYDTKGKIIQKNIFVYVDNTPPKLSIIQPAAAASLHGIIKMEVSGKDDINIAKTELYIDNILYATNIAHNYTFSIDTSKFAIGGHALKVILYDTAGNASTQLRFVKFVETGCEISLSACPNAPKSIGTYFDNVNNSSSSKSECVLRASYYYELCGGQKKMGENKSISRFVDSKGNEIQKTEIIGSKKVFFTLPKTKPISTLLMVDRGAQFGEFGIHQWFKNPNTANGDDVPVFWGVGNYTGFFPKKPWATQMGLSNEVKGSSAIQAEDGEIGTIIDTETSGLPSNKIVGIIGGAGLAVTPFSKSESRILIYSIDVQIPYVVKTGSAVAHSGQALTFYDTISKRQFWYAFTIFDERGIQHGNEYLMLDKSSKWPLISSAAGNPGQLSLQMGSAPFQSKTWKGYKKFIFAISAAELSTAIERIKNKYPAFSDMSSNPEDYRLGSFNFDSEIDRQKKEGNARMGFSYKNLTVYSVNGGTFCNPRNMKVIWMCGAGVPEGDNWGANSNNNGCYQRVTTTPCQEK